jgi:hypothetical protein
MRTDRDTYRQALLDLYLRLPDTPRRLSRFDLRLVRQLWEHPIPLKVIETASYWPQLAVPLAPQTPYPSDLFAPCLTSYP